MGAIHILKSFLVLSLKFNYIFITCKVSTIFYIPINNPINKSISKPMKTIEYIHICINVYITNYYYY